ncbi:MAG: SUMF1/EgtB/PvdO family nonheme iron enzyme, partial [Pseudomonadota bacterium]
MIGVPEGRYSIGSDEGLYEDEAPVHDVLIKPFSLGKFPVTNAEWRLFMDAEGYEDERWWETDEARAWRSGESTAEGPKKQRREDRKWCQDNLDQLREFPRQGRMTSEEVKGWERIAWMSDEAFEALLEDWFSSGRQTQPAYWNDDAFNNPAQPVVGISWHEARAYCAWLSAQTDRCFRLPAEVECEAAARGFDARRYAYADDFDASRCNTFESHIRRTSPVGVFSGGETPEGLVDMSGNVWEWTG